jgi:glyoxylate reductase
LSVLPKTWVVWPAVVCTENGASAFPYLKLTLMITGAAYDEIDRDACSERKPPLRVSNVPVAVNNATADTAMFLILGVLRNFNPSMQTIRRGEWRGEQPASLGRDPEGKVLGILGMGGIGTNLSLKAAAFGIKQSTITDGRLTAKELAALNTFRLKTC